MCSPEQIAAAASDLARANAGLGLLMFLNWRTIRAVVSALVLQEDLMGADPENVEVIEALKAQIAQHEEDEA